MKLIKILLPLLIGAGLVVPEERLLLGCAHAMEPESNNIIMLIMYTFQCIIYHLSSMYMY